MKCSFCNNINIITFDQFNVSLLNNIINFFQKVYILLAQNGSVPF